MRTSITSAAAVAVLALSACGQAAEADGVATLEDSAATTAAVATEAESGAVDVEAAMLEFAACLREHGLEIEDPTVDADGNIEFGRPGGGPGEDADLDREAFAAAREACVPILDGVALGFRELDETALADTLLEFAACMRENGFDMPDPDLSNFGPGAGAGEGEGAPGGGPFGGVDFADPDFQAALEACGDIMAGFGPGPRPGGGE